jgi:hypothetical protein
VFLCLLAPSRCQVAVLSILAAAHVPLEAREHTSRTSRVQSLSFPQISSAHMQVCSEAGRAECLCCSLHQRVICSLERILS